MDYNNRLYYWELEEKYKIHFKVLKADLKGKGQDGITAAQKRKLHAIGVNVTGIKYKGTACQIIAAVENKEKYTDAYAWHGPIYRVKKISGGKTTMSPELFDNPTDAEYYAARRVKPEDDAMIVSYIPYTVWAVISYTGTRYFPTKENAQFVQNRKGGALVCYVSR